MKKRIFIILAVVLLLSTLTIGLFGCGPEKASDKIERGGILRADGKNFVNSNGDLVSLAGTNLGGWLVQESYLVPTDVKEEFGQIDMLLELANRPDFGKEKAYQLVDVYEDNWVTEADFKFIADLGMTCVRLPFSYLNLYDPISFDEATGKYVRTPYSELALRQNAFERLDWAIAMGKKYGLYVILDMHGAVGSQNGNDHSGDISLHNEGGCLWEQSERGEICREKTKELWVEIAKRYKSEPAVAFYDLLNEPGVKDQNGNQKTTKQVWDYFDELLKAIRAVDPDHVICMESCWEAGDLPAADEYGWTNVAYQYHHYNWTDSRVLNKTYYGLKQLGLDSLDVPVFIGEFNVWGDAGRTSTSTQTDEDAWKYVIQLYCSEGWHFTTWNFKCASTNSSWGLLNLKEDIRQANFKTDSFKQIAEAWRAGNSSNYKENEWLVACVKPYLTFNEE